MFLMEDYIAMTTEQLKILDSVLIKNEPHQVLQNYLRQQYKIYWKKEERRAASSGCAPWWAATIWFIWASCWLSLAMLASARMLSAMRASFLRRSSAFFSFFFLLHFLTRSLLFSASSSDLDSMTIGVFLAAFGRLHGVGLAIAFLAVFLSGSLVVDAAVFLISDISA